MKWFLLILQYFPLVLQAVKAVEDAVGSAIPSTSKKELVLTAVLTAAKLGENVDQNVVKVISTLIDDVVTALNKSGVFTSKPKP